jgi:hypothetical protein
MFWSGTCLCAMSFGIKLACMHVHANMSVTCAGDLNTLSPLDEEAYKSSNLLSVLLEDERLTNKFLKFGTRDDASTADYDFDPMKVLLDAGMTDLAVGHAETW